MASFDDILESLPDLEASARSFKDILLANLAMFAEIPAPTFQEEDRIAFLINRFKEAGISRQSIDEMGNGVGIIEGSEKDKNILLVAHADTVFDKTVDHTVQIQPGMVKGPGVADNSLGLAVLASIPPLFEEMDLALQHNLILAGATRSLGRGDLEGLRFFLSNFKEPIIAGLGIEGVELGRISHISIGMQRGEISCHIPSEYDWSRFGDASAILTINEIINEINEIRLPQRPRTTIVLSSVHGGSSFTTAKNATLRFEVRSESTEMVKEIDQRIREIIEDISSRSGDSITLDILAQRQPGGISNAHPFVKNSSRILQKMNIEPRPGPSTSELSTFINREIPAITLGISYGDQVRNEDASVQIEPIYKGVAQIIGILQAIDRGYCEKD